MNSSLLLQIIIPIRSKLNKNRLTKSNHNETKKISTDNKAEPIIDILISNELENLK